MLPFEGASPSTLRSHLHISKLVRSSSLVGPAALIFASMRPLLVTSICASQRIASLIDELLLRPFFETSDDPIYLVTFDDNSGTSWSSFTSEFGKVFAPFTWGAWLMIVLISLPLLGLLMMYHEYAAPGSAYPRTAPVLETDPAGSGTEMIRNRKIPMVNHIGRSLYMAALSFFQESYDQSVVTTGGKIHLLAISSLVYRWR